MSLYTTTKKPSISIMGIEHRTANTPDKGPIDIPKLWERFFSEGIFSKIPNKTSNDVIALYCDYEGDCTKPYSIVIGCQVSAIDSIPEGMVCKTLPASNYALFSAVGEHPKTLIDTWGAIWQTDLKRTYSGDFEVYGDQFAKEPKQVEVLIAIH